MAETKSIFVDIARLRWPKAHPVSGAGAFAIISHCPVIPFVRLYETAMEAQPIVGQPCPHAFCKMQHTLVRLDQQQPTAPRTAFRKKPHWVKDVDRAG